MPIPEEIRKVPRPKNTVVAENKEDGPKHYAVRSRKGSKYVPGSNPQPINGNVIGYIYKGEFVPIDDQPAVKGPSSASYGASALVIRESKDYLDDLLESTQIDYAVLAYVVALLKIVKPGLKAKRASVEYRRTFIGQSFPGVKVSSNTLTDLYRRLGMDDEVRRRFAQKRLDRVAKESRLIVDGMLKQDNSSVNDLSGFSFKSRVKGIGNISIICAYDLERKEIVCSQVFPGNHIDASAYSRFVCDNDITNGILVTDKGFPPSMLEEELGNRPKLHFLTPLKRNDVRIDDNHMLDFDGVLKNTDEKILYRMAEIKGGKHLYSFRDSKKASIEETIYLENIRRKKKKSDNAEFLKKKEDFGTIVFLSDVKMTAEEAYSCYSDRWKIELVFRFFKSDPDIHSTDVQDDYTVIGEEFVNTIASGITCRLMNLFKETKLLEEMSFGDIMDDLSGVWRSVDAPEGIPDRDDRYWIHPFGYAMDTMVRLKLCSGEVKGKKPKKKEQNEDSVKETEQVEKRPRGRPRKNPQEPEKPKRPRGRPRKDPQAEEKPKKPRGRPRKNPV